MHTATRGPGRRKQHYSQATLNMHMDVPKANKDRNITLQDVKLIMPTLLILLFTIFIMVTVIPYAFSSVIKQLKAVRALEAAEAAARARLSNMTEMLGAGGELELEDTTE